MSAVWDWLSTPLSGAAIHAVEPWVYWHARLMVLTWGVLLPGGVLLARYFKVLPSQPWPATLDNTWWWHGHRSLQWSGMVLASLGVYLVWERVAHTPLGQLHGLAGWLLMGLGWLQILGGLLRGSKGGPTAEQVRGDHYDMTPHRRWFEWLHKLMGWTCVVAAIGVMLAGLLLADAPRWMLLSLLLWWCTLAGLAWRWQQQGRCIDTYQAIWGPDAHHPGNQRQPIGWGIRRPFENRHHGPS